MLTFLFWNTNGKDIPQLVAELAKAHDVDVLILAECRLRDADLLEGLNAAVTTDLYHLPFSVCTSIRVFTRFSVQFIEPLEESGRYSFRRLRLPGRDEIILGVVHLPSKLYWTEDSHVLECTNLARLIEHQEARAGHSRTLLIGDFNMNPFEKGLVGASGLQAVMSRDVARKRTRTVLGLEYPFFYNPMWSHFGDGGAGPPEPTTMNGRNTLTTSGISLTRFFCGRT